MISGACHCGAVTFSLAGTPEWLTECNCSVCRRLGTLSAHAEASRMAVNRRLADPETVAPLRIRHFDGADTWRYLD